MEFFSLLFIFFLLAVLPLCVLFLSSSKKVPNPHGTSPLKSYPLIGSLPEFIRNRHRLLDWQTELLAASPTNTVYIKRLGNVQGFITANPAVVEHVLKTNFDNFPKGPRSTSILEDFLGEGIFNSDGEKWKVQRKTASFEFNTKSLRSFVVDNVRDEVVTRLLPLLGKAAESGGGAATTLDLQDVLERFAFDNVCKVSFNVDPGYLAVVEDGGEGHRKLTSGFAESFRVASYLSAERFRYVLPRLWKLKRFLGIGSEKQLAGSIATVHDFATQIIRSRKKEKGSSNSSSLASSIPAHADLLSRFIANEDNSEEYLRDIVISFILAGRETTSSSLSWFFWLLSSRPGVEGKILEELKSLRVQKQSNGDDDETFNFEELREMHYLHAAISEALRLYPPVAVNATTSRADDVLPDGSVLKKGWFVAYNSYAMGRMESIWGEDCREYKPERWLEEGVFKPANMFKFPAFHAGPRMCLGKEMAYIQMKSIAASVLERFEVAVVNKEVHPEMMLSLTLRMKRGLPVQVTARSSN